MTLLTDPRTADWFLLQTPPVTIACILIGYVVMIRKGPQLMEDRKPFDLKYVMMAYNLFQVVANLLLGCFVSLTLIFNRILVKVQIPLPGGILLVHKAAI